MGDLFSPNVPTLPFEMPTGEGYRIAWDENWNGFHLTVPDGWIFYVERFFNAQWSNRIIEYFQENDTVDWRRAKWRDVSAGDLDCMNFSNIKWKQDTIKLYGKVIPLPRLTAWYGDAGKDYTYSGIKSRPNQWNDGLLHIKNKIEQVAGAQFNSVLLNWYRDGQDHLNWHADDEKGLGQNPLIASANFGAERDFIIRRNIDHSQKITVPLKNGTVLLMGGSLQHFWQHSVPKRKGIDKSRFNLTFRRIIG